MKTKRLSTGLLAVIMAFSILFASGFTTFFANDRQQVHVIIENTTYTIEDAPWSGTLVDKWVDLSPDSTMMSCFVDALGEYSQVGAESGYISEVNELAAFDGGAQSGWMGTLNDWFTNEGFSAISVASGTLDAGDEIRIMYTMDFGADLGGSWGNTDKTLKNLSFSEGSLSPAFDKNIHEYTLTVPADIKTITVTPTASNKNYQVRTFANETEYKRTSAIPITNGSVINIKCGDPAWPSMNTNDGEAQEYAVTIECITDNAAVNDVIAKIDAIGNVTLSSENAIAAARTAYDSLTENQQTLVKNYSALLDAETVYTNLVKVLNEKNEEIYKTVGDHIANLGTPSVGSVGGEWMVIGLARSDRDVSAEYYNRVVQYVNDHINDRQQLHRAKSTDNARVILALTALGYDVTNVGGHNLLQGLTDIDYIKNQGINGPIWALIAFDSHNYNIPAGNVTRGILLNTILEAQLPDGGWALSGSEADTDTTAMAIQALAPYYKEATIKEAVNKALTRLASMQTADGGFSSWGSTNSESCAQVITALTALGIDPHTDSRFIKNGCSVLDALLTFYTDGGFRHTADGQLNGMATEQGYYALVSYMRLKNGKTSLYNMCDVVLCPGEATANPDDEIKEPDDSQMSTPTVQTPQTDDASNVLFYFGVMALSFVGFALTIYKQKRS